ncbi:MAG TPA: glycosyltransferase [Acidimicrobiales bacterium]|nr:glycosyltransferase [Acidimicrobiales bacterium]
MSAPVLSLVMPAYNEAATIEEIVKEVTESPWVDELLIVDDGSTDGTGELARRLSEADGSGRIRLLKAAAQPGQGVRRSGVGSPRRCSPTST